MCWKFRCQLDWLAGEPPRELIEHTSGCGWMGHGSVTIFLSPDLAPRSFCSAFVPLLCFRPQWTKHLCFCQDSLALSQPIMYWIFWNEVLNKFKLKVLGISSSNRTKIILSPPHSIACPINDNHHSKQEVRFHYGIDLHFYDS